MKSPDWTDSWPGMSQAHPVENPPDGGKVDPWAREVTETFRSVINRPKSGMCAEPFHKVPQVWGTRTLVEVLGTGDKFNLFVHWNRDNLRIHVHPENMVEERFSFSAVISRAKPIKVRKLALVLCKKLTQKAVWDILKS